MIGRKVVIHNLMMKNKIISGFDCRS